MVVWMVWSCWWWLWHDNYGSVDDSGWWHDGNGDDNNEKMTMLITLLNHMLPYRIWTWEIWMRESNLQNLAVLAFGPKPILGPIVQSLYSHDYLLYWLLLQCYTYIIQTLEFFFNKKYVTFIKKKRNSINLEFIRA